MRLKLYLWILIVSIFTIWGVNFFLVNTGASALAVHLWGFLNPIAIIAVDGLFAFIIRHTFLPESWFAPEKKCYLASDRELAFYRSIGIKKWKDLVPDVGKAVTGTAKGSISGTNTDYLHQFLVETTYGEVIHIVLLLTGFIPCFFVYLLGGTTKLLVTMLIPQGLVNVLLNLPPVFIQRYNRPKLLHMYQRQIKKEQNLEKADK